MTLFLHWNWRHSWWKLSWLYVFAKWTSGMLSAAYYSCLSFFWPDAELVIIVLECECRQCRSACNVAIMPYYTRRSLDEWSFLRSRRHRRRPSPTKYPVLIRCSYKVLRAQPWYFAKCSFFTSCPIQVLAHTSSFAPRSRPSISIWLTIISSTSYDALRSHSRTADADPGHDCRAEAAHNGFGERARSCCYPYVSHLL